MAFRPSILQQATLYKFRYLLGYGFIIVLLLVIVLADASNTPNGLSQAEMQQAVTSTSLHFTWNMSWVINGVYNFIQQLSVDAFGLSRLSLILPSLIFGTATVILFSMTMRHWFSNSVAVVGTVIAMTSVPFVTMMRSGTPEIMLPFWTILLLYAAVRLLVKKEKAFLWKFILAIACLGLLYTPFGIYPLVAIIASSLFHPHVRSRIRHIPRVRIFTLAIIAFVGLLPLVFYIALQPSEIGLLIGIDLIREGLGSLRTHASQIYDMYLNFPKNGFSGTQIIPVYNLATVALAIFGFLKSLRDRYMARSYVLLTWTGVTILGVLVMPELVVLTFMPTSLLVAIGIDALIREWYKLFPRNPYAQVAGLIPLTILFLGIAAGNISHYFNNYTHMGNPHFTQSLPAIKEALVIEGNHDVILVTTETDVLFYSILKQEFPELKVTTELPATTATPTFVLPNTGKNLAAIPSRILTSDRAENSVVLRIYRPQQ